MFKRGSKQYIASEVGSTTTYYIRRHISQLIPSIPSPRVVIKWVTSPKDPIFQKDGTLIIRLKETNDQTRNILAATRIVLPQIVFPALRSRLEKYAESAIDLTILKNLTDQLGVHALPVFHRYFLNPEVKEDPSAENLFVKLTQLDNSGIFVSIFLQELVLLGEYVHSTGDNSNRTNEIISLIEFLIEFAGREVGQQIKLEFFSDYFKIAIVLLAISVKAELEGLPPYLRRMDLNIKLGCDSIYIAAYPKARRFFQKLMDALDTEGRLLLHKRNQVLPLTAGKRTSEGVSEVALFRRNLVYDVTDFKERVNSLGYEAGMVVDGVVRDVSKNAALIDIGGMFGVVTVDDCSWVIVNSCQEVFTDGDGGKFYIKEIDFDTDNITLSAKLPSKDPWANLTIPKSGDKTKVFIQFYKKGEYICRTENGLQIIIPATELTWGLPRNNPDQNILSKWIDIFVLSVSEDVKKVVGSVRQLDENPWHKIHAELNRSKVIVGTVLEVASLFIRVLLPNGLEGYIPRQYIEEAGFDYSTFTNALLPGKNIRVGVSNVFVERKKIRLNVVIGP